MFQRGPLAGDCHLVNLGLARILDLTQPKRPVETQLEPVKVSHSTKTKKDRIAAGNLTQGRATMGHGDVGARSHDL